MLTADHLPATAAELAEVIGLAALTALVECRGGTVLHVPQPHYLRDDHPLVLALGWNAARTLADHYQRERIDVPRCVEAVRAARDAEIHRLTEEGWSARQLALRYGLTERAIKYIRARVRDTAEPPQLTLV